jgi:transcriptional regulator with XRE-family HTH domain
VDQLRFGRQFRALRVRARRRQQDVADQAGVSRSLIASIDRGQLDGVTIGAIVRAAAALGAEVDLRLRYRGEHLDRLVDEDHALLVEAVVARLTRLGWTVEVEVSFSIWGERGSIDVLAFHPRTAALLVVEAKSRVADSQGTIHGLDRKTRLAPQIARERGWTPGSVSRVLAIASSATARRRIELLSSTYDVALPIRGVEMREFLRRPAGRVNGLMFVSVDSHGGTRRSTVGRERVRLRIGAR